MSFSEHDMKKRGEEKVWKPLKDKNDNYKKAHSTQLGIKMLFDDALEMFDDVKKWIETGSAKTYRRELGIIFSSDEIILEKTVQTLLFLSGSTDTGKTNNKKVKNTKSVVSFNKK